MRKSEKVLIFLIIISFVLAFYFYPSMPENMASHWNIEGQVDDYLPKSYALFLFPFLLVFFYLLFNLFPRIDPLKENIEKFRKHFDNFIVLISLFFFYLYSLTLFWNLGQRFNMTILLSPSFAVLFYFTGQLLEKSKRNWFIGIRTPWTLSSDNVWAKTHNLGAKLFKAVGVLSLLGVFFSSWLFFLIVISVLIITFYLVVYSYLEYQKEKRK